MNRPSTCEFIGGLRIDKDDDYDDDNDDDDKTPTIKTSFYSD